MTEEHFSGDGVEDRLEGPHRRRPGDHFRGYCLGWRQRWSTEEDGEIKEESLRR